MWGAGRCGRAKHSRGPLGRHAPADARDVGAEGRALVEKEHLLGERARVLQLLAARLPRGVRFWVAADERECRLHELEALVGLVVVGAQRLDRRLLRLELLEVLVEVLLEDGCHLPE